MFDDISKESNAILISMYKRYLELRKVGEPRFNARYFGDAANLKEQTGIRLSDADITDIMRCLSEYGYVTCEYYDMEASEILLTEKAIAVCEHRFVNGLKAVAEALAVLKEFFP